MDNNKRKINMLSPEEMKHENTTPIWSGDIFGSGTINTPEEACEGKSYGAGCRWVDETAKIHDGVCKYDYERPRPILVCFEDRTDSGTL